MKEKEVRLSELSFSYAWVKELQKAEDQVEQTGILDGYHAHLDLGQLLAEETMQFLVRLKHKLVEVSTAFNQWKTSPHGRVKIYGIAKTHADFMLFRNGFKMIFSYMEPGIIQIRYNFFVSHPEDRFLDLSKGESDVETTDHVTSTEDTRITARMSPFGDIRWFYKEHEVSSDSIVRYHFTLFIRESMQ